jgi:hypothetical protein
MYLIILLNRAGVASNASARLDYVIDVQGLRGDLIPSFGTKLSMISAKEKGNGVCRGAGTPKRR